MRSRMAAGTKGDKEEYQEYFKKKMKEHGLEGLEGTDPDKLKAFMEDVDAGWTSDKEASIPRRLDRLARVLQGAAR